MIILKLWRKKIPSSGNIPHKKQELVDYIVRQTAGDSFFDNFSDLQKRALAEIAHCTGGMYHRSRMAAKYGQEYAESGPDSDWSLLDVFIVDKMVSQDVCDRIRNIFPRPVIDRIQSDESLQHEIRHEVYGSKGKQIDVIPLDERCTELEAIQNLEIVLRCIESGKIKISATSRCPTGASIIKLADNLTSADWYERPSYGGIQAFAWPLMLQAAGFVAASASSLSLSVKGKNILSRKISAHDAIRSIWDSWKSKALIDEFSRIDVIKGQRAKGRVQARAKEGIPQTVEVMLLEANTRIAEFTFEGRACLLACKNKDLLHQIRHDVKLKHCAIVAEPSFVTLLPGRENEFFQRLRALGYSVPVAEKIVS